MKVTIELIDELRSRVNVSYDEAKRVLEKNDGDLIKSIIELEKEKGTKATGTVKQTNTSFSEFVDKVLQFKLSIKSKDGDTLINLPLILVALLVLMAFWVVLFGIVLGIICNCKFKIYKAHKYSNVNDIKENIKHTVKNVKVTTEKIFNEDENIKVNNNTKQNSNKNDENEIIIE